MSSKLKKLPIYELNFVIRTGEIEALAFQDFKDDPAEGIKVVKHIRQGVEKLLPDFDKRWVALCDGDMLELTEWASRMRFIRSQLDEIDRNLAVFGTRLFDWTKVYLAMGYVNAFRVAIEQVLDHSERA
jgi:hypothetical protein